MNLADYQTAAERTMYGALCRANNPRELMTNAALGMCGEAAEILKADTEENSDHILDECGDMLWYVAQWCNAHGETIGSFVPHTNAETREECLRLLWYATGQLADMTKKYIYHQKPINALARHLAIDSIVCSVHTMLAFYHWYIEEAAIANNDKLRLRFPEGGDSMSDDALIAHADRADLARLRTELRDLRAAYELLERSRDAAQAAADRANNVIYACQVYRMRLPGPIQITLETWEQGEA